MRNFPQETLVQYKNRCLPGFGLAQLDGLGYLSLPGDGLSGHGGPGPLVRRDQLTSAARGTNYHHENLWQELFNPGFPSQTETAALQPITTAKCANLNAIVCPLSIVHVQYL